jgi:hypothetical protein
MNASEIMQVSISTRRRNRRHGCVRIRLRKDRPGHFVSWKETLLGVVLLTASLLALQYIASESATVTEIEAPASASAYRT